MTAWSQSQAVNSSGLGYILIGIIRRQHQFSYFISAEHKAETKTIITKLRSILVTIIINKHLLTVHIVSK